MENKKKIFKLKGGWLDFVRIFQTDSFGSKGFYAYLFKCYLIKSLTTLI
jgi:hypothetical protein